MGSPTSSFAPAAATASPSPSSSDLSPADGFLCGNHPTNPGQPHLFLLLVLVPAPVGNSVEHLAYPRPRLFGVRAVKEGVDEMIKHVANEPSVGLYFVQQHAHASMPLLLDVKGKVAEKTHEVTLHTEDIEDSICAVRSMAEFGLPIADDMIKDINKSLKIMSKTQPKRGLIQNPSWGFQAGKSSGTWDDVDTTNDGSSRNYLSSMFNTAKQKASSLRWPQPDFITKDDVSEKSVSSAAPESSQTGGHGASTPSDAERDDLPVSSRLSENNNAPTMNQSLSASDISQMVESYKKFKEEQELKLQEWLRESKEAEDHRE